MTLIEQIALTVIVVVTLLSLRYRLRLWPQKLHPSDMVAIWVVGLVHVASKQLTGYSLVPYLIGSWAIIGLIMAFVYHFWRVRFVWLRFVRHWWRLASIVTFGVYIGVVSWTLVVWWQSH